MVSGENSAAARFARVAIESPLPQLDRLFDYRIPDQLAETCLPGVRVRVPFGKGAALHDGFVVEVATSSDFVGEANLVAEVVSPVSVLPEGSYRLLRAVADRQAGVLSELTKLAVPKRSVRVEKAWIAATANRDVTSTSTVLRLNFRHRPLDYSGRNTLIAEPRIVPTALTSELGTQLAQSSPTGEIKIQGWIAHLVAFALEQLHASKSAILIVPDFRDQNRLAQGFELLGIQHLVTHYSTDQLGSARYSAFLRCLESQPTVVIGSRAAAYAPVKALGGIAIYDDGDESLSEPTAPYVHTRDVALIRQQQTDCSLLLIGHARSAEVERLLEIRYLKDLTGPFAKPKIAVTQPGLRVDPTSFQAAREALDAGKPVLVQVAATGNSTGTYCASCGERSRCRFCNGPLFLDSAATPKCRWCSAINLGTACHACGQTKTRSGVAGSTRTAAELGKAFPGAQVVESTYAHRVESVKPGKRLVVATPGAEPYVDGGYGAVILLDGQRLAARDTLRATEQAVALWSNAISLLAEDGRAVGVGLATGLGKDLALWNQAQISAAEFASRRELSFPPACRMASLTGPKDLGSQVVENLAQSLGTEASIEVLGPIQSDQRDAAIATASWRYLIRYEYSVGEALAKELKSRVLRINAGNKSVN
ncbi:MAG: primosomal protein N', partial [Micrococcales bacterium]